MNDLCKNCGHLQTQHQRQLYGWKSRCVIMNCKCDSFEAQVETQVETKEYKDKVMGKQLYSRRIS